MNAGRLCIASVSAGLALAAGLWPQAALPHAQTTTTVQFDREIVRVLDNHCVMCHGEQGPAFPLVTYEQTYAARWQIRQDVLEGHMAPWAAVAGFGDFLNSNGLTQRERDFVASWAESFGPRNNGEVYAGVAAAQGTTKPVQAHLDLGTWALGKPDLLVGLAAHPVASQQTGTVNRSVIDLQLKSQRWLRALEYRPGDRRVVHSADFSILETGQWLASWTPWGGASDLPRGLAYGLPPGSHIIAEIHYYGSAQPLIEQGSLGLYFADAPSARAVGEFVLDPRVVSPTTGSSQKLAATMKLEADTNILALQPLIRPGVQSIEVIAKPLAGMPQILLYARDIPPQWPTPYVFRKPVSLTKGTQLSVMEHYAGDSAVAAGAVPVKFSAYQGTPLAPRFRLSGTIKSVDVAAGRLLIQHGDIPGFMGAMTMDYAVGKHEALRDIAAGDQIRSDIVAADSGAYLENIEVIRPAR